MPHISFAAQATFRPAIVTGHSTMASPYHYAPRQDSIHFGRGRHSATSSITVHVEPIKGLASSDGDFKTYQDNCKQELENLIHPFFHLKYLPNTEIVIKNAPYSPQSRGQYQGVPGQITLTVPVPAKHTGYHDHVTGYVFPSESTLRGYLAKGLAEAINQGLLESSDGGIKKIGVRYLSDTEEVMALMRNPRARQTKMGKFLERFQSKERQELLTRFISQQLLHPEAIVIDKRYPGLCDYVHALLDGADTQ